jgi:hypothetical protein
VRRFTKKTIRKVAEKIVKRGSHVVTDGLGCFKGLADAGCTHEPIITGTGRKAARHPSFKAINTALANNKTAIAATFRTASNKHAGRRLAEFAYRFTRRYDLPSLIPRLGWLAAPAPFIEQLGKVIEYNTSCSQVFVQRAGIAAIEQGDAVIARTRARFRTARDHLCAALNALPGVHAPPPPGAMYAFFRVDGLTDSLEFCKRLVSDNGVGLAPGAAFGDEGEGFVRWCFASDPARLDRALERFAQGLAAFRSQK